MQLAVPIFTDDGKIYNECEYHKPKTGVITRTYEIAKRSGIFHAMLEFVSGCVVSLTSTDGEIIDNPIQIKKLMGLMPYITAETICIKAMALLNDNDVVEGVYPCPRCSKKYISEFDPDLGIDTRDRISDLEIKVMDEKEYKNEIDCIPNEPVIFRNKNNGEILQEINNFTIRFPNMNDCIIAGRNMQPGQEVRVQINLYIQSIIKVNEEPVNKSWKGTYGQLLFKELYSEDVEQLGSAMEKYGLNKVIEKTCSGCGKVWSPVINTSNFFALGLQSV